MSGNFGENLFNLPKSRKNIFQDDEIVKELLNVQKNKKKRIIK